ncbi:MAG: type II CAAX endopeptidase family protein, partial [Gemmatimonadota bacterium]
MDIDMDRSAAMDSAAALADRYGWGAPDDRSAATFGLADDQVQTFVELEGGGSSVVERLAERNVYEAYQWRVRRFAEGRVEETWTRFTPQGEPYGFLRTLAEDDPGTGNMSVEEARNVAEATAAEWGVDLGSYRPVESSSETLPAGRVDHTFVYERTDERIGDARFRLRLVVAGTEPSELTHFVSIPQAFSRRYADMRSTNESIALVAQAVLFFVFGLLGAGVGSAMLLRRRWLEWRRPLVWGAAIAVVFGAATVNQLPLTWTSYDTALSATSFTLQQVAGGLAIALLGTPLIAFFLLAGESLGRRAFPDHVQQWRFWSPEVASSNTALGMTGAAYLLVGIQVGYVVLFYLGTQRLEGWWSPADALVQPDLLATYQPWLEAVSLAFFASFWEESLFRAVPIACAALLGARFGRRRLWIVGAVLFQAIIFAAGHANYPQQPPYARVIELAGPALVWGIVYVRYGLVPTITAHFLYDLSLISLVLFESDARIDQGVIVLVGLVPLAVLVVARLRHGARSRPPEAAYNGAWTPAAPPEPAAGEHVSGEAGALAEARSLPEAAAIEGEGDAPPVEPADVVAGRLPSWSLWAALLTGIVSVVAAWALRTPPPALEGTRSEAVAAASAELEGSGVSTDDWDVFVTTSSGVTEGRAYVFAEAGPEAFEELEGRYFGVPRWLVRYVDWSAEPAERVEEYRVWVGPGGEVGRVSHTLPEARPGASLSVSEARRLALEAATSRLGVAASGLREVEAEETSQPNRTDWFFTFTETGRLPDVEGEVRIQVRVAGDEVSDVARSIHVPEGWERELRRRQSRNQIMRGGLALLLLVGFGGMAVTGVVVWSRGRLPTGVLWKLTATAFVAMAASSANDWPATVATFATSQPWSFQAGATVIGLALAACLVAPAVGLVGSLAHAWLGRVPSEGSPVGVGGAFGLALAGLALLGSTLVPSPPGAAYFGAVSAVPLLSASVSVVAAFLLTTSAVLVLAGARKRFGQYGFVSSTIWSLVV